jgi:hypothetical protein
LHANLGHHDLKYGRYSQALRHWERGYQLSGPEERMPGKRVTDYTLAY